MRIRQILINVLNNAVKYTNEGSVTLSIQCGARSGERLDMIYTVSDTGIGIKKESIPYLFNAFKRVDEDKTRHIEGTGLGLSIVKQLVELMDGSITVNSAYTQGSTFVIQIPQTVVGEEQVGELDLESRHKNARTAYRFRFEAPEARVLIVDDNASNRLVVRKLLRETGVQVDCASSGEEALRMTLEKAYHVIFMDHLMPGMDGLECHRRILAQTGGRCRDSKIVALTANADSESRALYEKEGFDGCLTKPVDGAALERELSLQLPPELVHSLGEDDGDLLSESMAWIKAPQQKRLVAIAAESTADLPKKQMERYGIAAIPHLVLTEQGVFRDGLDLETGGLLAYMADSKHKVRATPPDAAAHERFFAGQLAGARDLVYVTLSQKIGNSAFPFAKEAAASFNNVTVLDSGHLSSGYGLQVLEAARMAEQGKTPAEIAKRLEETKELVQTSFIVDGLEYLARAGQVRTGTALLTKALSVRPVLSVKNGKLGVERVIFGSKRRAWRRYIELCLRTPAAVDERELFITHTGLSQQELRWIRGQVESRVRFDTVCCQKTSPSTAVNCGPGSFGLLFRKKES
ncbi:MAG: DegV family EDD domain-containing protein [Oscillospiraceae bacterium]|nr:DegV family EDD domain-containing protein [Oscillospiraceae bacterium]